MNRVGEGSAVRSGLYGEDGGSKTPFRQGINLTTLGSKVTGNKYQIRYPSVYTLKELTDGIVYRGRILHVRAVTGFRNYYTPRF